MTTGITEDTPKAEPTQAPPTRAEQMRAVVTLIKSGGLKPLAVYTYGQQKTAAKNTMYKYLGKSVVAGTAAMYRVLLPAVTAPAEGALRDKLIELLDRQAVVIQTAPLSRVALTWLAAGAPAEPGEAMTKAAMFRMGLNYHYRQPFEELFASEEGRAALGDGNVPTAVAQLVGPVAYGRLVGAARTTHDDHVRIVDEFLTSHRVPESAGDATATAAESSTTESPIAEPTDTATVTESPAGTGALESTATTTTATESLAGAAVTEPTTTATTVEPPADAVTTTATSEVPTDTVATEPVATETPTGTAATETPANAVADEPTTTESSVVPTTAKSPAATAATESTTTEG